jgi:putative ABC transport system permease protein
MPGGTVLNDVRHTLRLWARHPAYTVFAVLALAIGIGANVGVFSVVNALLVRSLPFRDPAGLVALRMFFPPHDSAADFHAWRAQSAYLDDAAVVEQTDANLGNAGELRRAHMAQVSFNFFDLLGARPMLGRSFVTGEDSAGRNDVAVIGYGLFEQLFAGDPRAIGAPIRVDGASLTIVGVAPSGFDYPAGAVLWKPARFSHGNNGWDTIARLKSGIGAAAARTAFLADADRLWPDRNAADRLANPPAIVSLRDELAGPARTGSLALMASVAIILLIACANVANLFLARSADRAPELQIRAALGATRARLARQFLTECALVSFAAALAGLTIAFWTTSLAQKLQPAPLASQAYALLDGRVAAFAIAVSILSTLLFGIIPSLHAARIEAPRSRATRSGWMGQTLIAAQVALTIVLLTASISAGSAFLKLMHLDRGFDASNVATVSVSLDGTAHAHDGRLAYFEDALDRIRRLHGVRSASATEFLPLNSPGQLGGPWTLEGRPADRESSIIPVFPDYFRSMGGRIVAGREFTDAEIRSDARVAVVSLHFAQQFDKPEAVAGRSISISRRPPWKVIGVVEGMSYLADSSAAQNQIFIPAHSPGDFYSTFIARVDGRAEDHLAAIRDAIRSVDPQVPVFGVKTMQQRLDDALARPQFYRTAVACFAGFALILALAGIYGIVAVTVAQRRQEMGVRMALGTTAARLRLRFLLRNLLTIVAGAIPGVASAVLAGRYLENLIAGAKSVDAITYAITVVFIAAAAAAGIWSATRPLANLDVMEILRTD